MRTPRRGDAGLEADVRRLAASRPFDLLPRGALQLLAFSCEKRELKSGGTLFAEAEPADGAYLVLDGEFGLKGRAGERRVGPGALIGETALLTEVDRSASAQALSDLRVLKIPRETFRRVISEFPDAAAEIKARAAGRLAKLLATLEQTRAREFDF